MVQSQIWYFVLYSWSLPCPCLQLRFSFLSQSGKTFHYFFVVKYLCSDLTLHQFSCLFLEFLISKVEVSKWCDLKLVSASGILQEEGSHPVGVSLDLVWDVFLMMKTPSDSWRMLCAVKSSPPQLLPEPVSFSLEFQKSNLITCLQLNFCLFFILNAELVTDPVVQG